MVIRVGRCARSKARRGDWQSSHRATVLTAHNIDLPVHPREIHTELTSGDVNDDWIRDPRHSVVRLLREHNVGKHLSYRGVSYRGVSQPQQIFSGANLNRVAGSRGSRVDSGSGHADGRAVRVRDCCVVVEDITVVVAAEGTAVRSDG